MSKEINSYNTFDNLAEEKKKKIMDACIEEFSENGYQNTSTNSIVKRAGISKGILFHYFSSKKNLYLYVLDFVTDFITEILYERIKSLPADFFERIMEIGIIKLKIAYEYPNMYKILIDAFAHFPDDLTLEIQKRYENLYKESIPVLYEGIDTSNFRSEINKEKALEFIMLALEGVNNKYMKIFKNMRADKIMAEMETITKDYNEYIHILKNGVYGK